MNNQEIGFDKFIDAFYNNKNGNKMVLELCLDSDEETSIYDIHVMLLQLFFIGITKYEVPFDDMQNYFNNINIKFYVQNFTVRELINEASGYGNRFMRIDNNMEMIKNGSHNENSVNELKDIKSFHTNNNEHNLCIYFDHMEC